MVDVGCQEPRPGRGLTTFALVLFALLTVPPAGHSTAALVGAHMWDRRRAESVGTVSIGAQGALRSHHPGLPWHAGGKDAPAALGKPVVKTWGSRDCVRHALCLSFLLRPPGRFFQRSYAHKRPRQLLADQDRLLIYQNRDTFPLLTPEVGL